MATKFYFHDATTGNTGTLPAGKHSASTPSVTATGANTQRSMDGTKGTTQTSSALTTLASTSAQPCLFRMFESTPLQAQTISAGNWQLSMAGSEANANANLHFTACVYVWRPSTGAVVGSLIFDLAAASTIEPSTSETAVTDATISGGSVTALSGDILVCEIWRDTTVQGNAIARVNTFFYDGTTEASASTNAAFLQAPANVPLISELPAAPVVQSASHQVMSGNCSVTTPSAVSSGTKLIAYLVVSVSTGGVDPVTSVKDVAGNTWTRISSFQGSAADQWQEWFALDTPAGDVGSTVTLTATIGPTNFGVDMLVQEVSGLLAGNTTAMLDGTPATNSASSTGPATTGSYSSAASGEFLVAVTTDPGFSVNISDSAGYHTDANNINSSSTANIIVNYKASTGGSESASFALSATDEWATTICAFQLASTGTNHPGAAALTGSGTLTSAGLVVVPGASTLTGAGTLLASGNKIAVGSAHLTGLGTLLASGGKGVPGSAALSGAGTLLATGSVAITGSATLAGLGTLLAQGVKTAVGSATLSGTGTLAASGNKTSVGAAVLSGLGTLLSAGSVLGTHAGSVVLSGVGTLGATGSTLGLHSGAAALTGAGSMAASGVKTAVGSASLSGLGTLLATASLSGIHTGAAALSGLGTLLASGAKTAVGSASLSGSGTLHASGNKTAVGSAILSGLGTLTAAGTMIARALAALTGLGTLLANGQRIPSQTTLPDPDGLGGTVTTANRGGTVHASNHAGTVTTSNRGGTVTAPNRAGTVTTPNHSGSLIT